VPVQNAFFWSFKRQLMHDTGYARWRMVMQNYKY